MDYNEQQIKQIIRSTAKTSGESVQTLIDLYINAVEDNWQVADHASKKISKGGVVAIIEMLSSLRREVGKQLID